MAQRRSRPFPLATGTGLGVAKVSSVCTPDYSAPLSSFQADFLSARFGLDGVRARLTAELCWGHP